MIFYTFFKNRKNNWTQKEKPHIRRCLLVITNSFAREPTKPLPKALAGTKEPLGPKNYVFNFDQKGKISSFKLNRRWVHGKNVGGFLYYIYLIT